MQLQHALLDVDRAAIVEEDAEESGRAAAGANEGPLVVEEVAAVLPIAADVGLAAGGEGGARQVDQDAGLVVVGPEQQGGAGVVGEAAGVLQATPQEFVEVAA